jgi:hypothetical protein
MFLRLDDCIFNAFLSFGNLHQDYIKILFERNYKIAVGFFQLHKLILEKLHQGTNPSPQPPAPLLEQPRVRAPKLGLGLGLSASLLKMHFLVSPPSGLGSSDEGREKGLVLYLLRFQLSVSHPLCFRFSTDMH